MNEICIIVLIYKSIEYLNFIYNQIQRYGEGSQYLFIANDATTEVLQHLKENNINHLIYNDLKPDDYYINRVYRAWNFGGFNCPTDIICFVNSDMAFSPNWLSNLYQYLNKDTIPTSRLVESGKMPSGKHGISKNFGRHPNEYQEKEFIEFAEQIKHNDVKPEGLFMPVLFYKKDFIESGGYPPGNFYTTGFGRPEGQVDEYNKYFLMSGDAYLFYNRMKHKKHITIMDSIVYHIAEGERDSD